MLDKKLKTEDIWRTRRAADLLSKWFDRHILPLFMAYRIGSETLQENYTGFLLRHKGVLYWITAGHIVDQIRKRISDPDVQIRKKRWMDRCGLYQAEMLPALFDPDMMFSVVDDRMDVGAIKISYIEENSLSSNNPLVIMDENAWLRVNAPNPQGFYLIGYPTMLNTSIETELSKNRTHYYFNAPLQLLPIESLEDNQTEFHGRILPFLEEAYDIFDDIDGMSGGPVFSLEDFGGAWKYRLIAVQSAWNRVRREICAVPMERVTQILEQWNK